MISSTAYTSTLDVYDLKDKVATFVAKAKALAADGLTVGEFAELAVALMRVTIATLDNIPTEGSQKKAWVLEAVGLLFDAVADKCVPLVAWPLWLIFRPGIRQMVLLAAGGAVEALLPLVRRSAE